MKNNMDNTYNLADKVIDLLNYSEVTIIGKSEFLYEEDTYLVSREHVEPYWVQAKRIKPKVIK